MTLMLTSVRVDRVSVKWNALERKGELSMTRQRCRMRNYLEDLNGVSAKTGSFGTYEEQDFLKVAPQAGGRANIGRL